ncbi:DUF2935 domain-containing protein [Anaeroselena agilis]|uniref:DUF2935 domain-containing protein n=1 Tax=Anaeroselena agilis TaxID=3063788 RepID=A0ABU3NSX8_9FIRM|nr:DUF2935 domain-containing protein [Selenomonadales bacterium 4137-cl]
MDIFCRGVKPFPPPALAEVCFWLRIMRDHAQFIELGLPCEEGNLKIEAQGFLGVFDDLEDRLGRASCEEEINRLVMVATVAVGRFFVFNRHILHLLIDCRLCGSCLYPLFVDHLSREALYCRKLLKKFTGCGMEFPVDAMVSENIFWVRGIGDHLKFVRDLIDPSERALVGRAKILGGKFDCLSLQARDLGSMLWHYRPNNELVRFEKDLRVAVSEAVEYFTATESLVTCCTAVSTIPPLLAEHIRREGEHCLVVLEMIRRCLLQDDAAEDEDEDADEDD